MDLKTPPGACLVIVGTGAGAGASTTAAALALAAARRSLRVAVLDLDECGGGLDVVFGIERQDAVRWAQVADSRGELDGAALLDALPRAGSIAVLSHGRELCTPPESVVQAALDAVSGECDLVLIDASRAADLSRFPGGSTCVVIAQGTIRGTGAAGATVQAARGAGLEPVVVLRDASDQLADELSEALEVAVVAHLPTERRVDTDLAHGEAPGGRGELGRVCDELLTRLLPRDAERVA